MRMPEMARHLGITRSQVYHLLNTSNILKTIVLDNQKRVTKESFYQWYASQDKYHIVSEQDPESVKKEEGRTIEAHRRKVLDRDSHGKYIGNDEYLTMQEAAILAGTEPCTIHKWIKKGKVMAIQSSHTVRIPRKSFEDWLQYKKKKEDQHGIDRREKKQILRRIQL